MNQVCTISLSLIVLIALVVSRTFAATPAFGHVFIVVEENHGYSSVVGNTSMPYLNMLINNGGLATQYYANQHNSLTDYLWLTSGSNDGVTSTTPTCPSKLTITKDSAARRLDAAGVSWKTYQEDLPSVGWLGCASGNYIASHNPFAFYSDIQNSSWNQKKMVPFTQFNTDLTNNAFPHYSFITPNLCNDAHDCSLNVADNWLKKNIDPLLNTNMFQSDGDGVLIITFDEGTTNVNGGGRIAWVIVGPGIKGGYRSTTFYQHQNTLKLMLEGLGLTSFPQGAASASDMREFFK